MVEHLFHTTRYDMALRRYHWVVALAGMLWWSGSAHAAGPGIRLGSRLVFHPSIAAEFRYDSNIFQVASANFQGGIFRLLPQIELATRDRGREGGSGVVRFRLFAGLDYNEFMTGNKLVSDHRMFGVMAGANATFWPVGRFTLELFDNYIRTSVPPYGVYPYNIDRNTNDIGLRMNIRPGGGRLELVTGYSFGIDLFEHEFFRDWDLFNHKMNLRLMWRFFPRTAAWIEAREDIYIYRRVGIAAHPNSYPLRVTAGVTGLITTKLSMNVWVGYGNGFYATGPNPNTGVGGLDLTWKPVSITEILIGYKHDFYNALLGSYYDLDAVYLSWGQGIWRLRSVVRVTYQNNRFQGIGPVAALTDPNNPGAMATDRMDHYINVVAKLDYPFKDWLALGIAYDMIYNKPNRAVDAGANGLLPVNFTKHGVSMRLSVEY